MDASREIEFIIGNLVVFFDCEVSFDYAFRRGDYFSPNEEDFQIHNVTTSNHLYYLDGDEIGEAYANEYFKEWIKGAEQFEQTRSLKRMIEIHAEICADDIATNYIQDNC